MVREWLRSGLLRARWLATDTLSSLTVDAIQQQHELDLSAARAQIRSLEEKIFQEEAARYEMLKANGDLKSQVESMQEALDPEKDKGRDSRRGSHEHAHDHSHTHNHADSDGHAHGPHPSAPSTPSSILSTPTRGPTTRKYAHQRVPSSLAPVDENAGPSSFVASPMSPPLIPVSATTPHGGPGGHVRRASLSLLKARMQDELGVEDLSVPLEVSTGANGTTSLTPRAGVGRRTRSAVLQDNLVWCSCCQGDLFVV